MGTEGTSHNILYYLLLQNQIYLFFSTVLIIEIWGEKQLGQPIISVYKFNFFTADPKRV